MRAPLRAPKLVWALLALAHLAVLALFWSGPQAEIVLDPASIQPETGSAYIAPLPPLGRFPFVYRSDADRLNASRLELLEDGRPLGPRHASHDDIRGKGAGRFSHWRQSLYFAASDGSDPRTNGREYRARLRGALSPLLPAALLLSDAALLLLLRRQVLAFVRPNRVVIAWALAAGAVAAAAAAALGFFEDAAVGQRKDAALVLAVLGHAVLGAGLTLAHWAIGAGIVRAALPKQGPAYAHIVLLGFPVGLAMLAILVAIALLLPFGLAVAAGLALLCLWPLYRWPLEAAPVRDLIRRLPGMLVFSLVYACWMAFEWHGPTPTLAGLPMGDQTFYASMTWAIAADPASLPHLANEGEFLSPFNQLLPALGAALRPLLELDGFLFIVAGTGVMGPLGAALALHAYLTTRPAVRLAASDAAVIALVMIAGCYYPSWLVSSPPAAHVVPLTVSVWFWAAEAKRARAAPPATLLAALVGSALSKVSAFATLGPFALAASLPEWRQLRPPVLVALALLAVLAAAFSALMLARYGPLFLQAVGLWPESIVNLRAGLGLGELWPYLARDAGCLVLLIGAFRVLPWPPALAVSIGLVGALFFWFVMRINLVCAIVILALAIVDAPSVPRSGRLLVVSGIALCLPAMLLTDPAGLDTSVVWFASIAGLAAVTLRRAVVSTADDAPARLRPLVPAAALVLVLVLIGVGRGIVPVTPLWTSQPLSPELLDIWKAVRERTPADALVFTDQAGREPTLLGGWNTYAMHGQRQVYHATWYQSAALRNEPELREARLTTNEQVLAGELAPTRVATSRPYGSFYAVVSAGRAMPDGWQPLYRNPTYALFSWSG